MSNARDLHKMLCSAWSLPHLLHTSFGHRPFKLPLLFTDSAVRYRGDVTTVAPQEVSAAVLSRLKSIAEEQLRTEQLKAVVTVPAYFQESQRQATLEACGYARAT